MRIETRASGHRAPVVIFSNQLRSVETVLKSNDIILFVFRLYLRRGPKLMLRDVRPFDYQKSNSRRDRNTSYVCRVSAFVVLYKNSVSSNFATRFFILFHKTDYSKRHYGFCPDLIFHSKNIVISHMVIDLTYLLAFQRPIFITKFTAIIRWRLREPYRWLIWIMKAVQKRPRRPFISHLLH